MNRVVMVMKMAEEKFHRFNYSAVLKIKLQVGQFVFKFSAAHLRFAFFSVRNFNSEFFTNKFSSYRKLAKLVAHRSVGDSLHGCLNLLCCQEKSNF
jgi:hypothetical protein